MRSGLCAALAAFGVVAVALTALTALTASWVGAQEKAQEEGEPSLALDLQSTRLPDLVETVARATGRTVLMDPALQGSVTVTAADAVSPNEAFQILQAALLMSGFGMAPGPEGVFKIVPIESAKGGAPWVQTPASNRSDRLVTALVRLKAANASLMANQLKGGIASSAVVLAYPPTNSLIIATTESRFQRILEIVRALDQGAATELQVVTLRWADAATTAGQIQQTFPPDEGGHGPYRVVADPRTNSLIIEGSKKRIEQIRRFMRTLDLPSPGKGNFHVVRVRNADAEELANRLASLQGATGNGALGGRDYGVVADGPTNSIIVRATPGTFAALRDVIAELDILPARVSLDVLLLEVATAGERDIGVDSLIPLLVPDDPGDPLGFVQINRVASLVTPEPPPIPFVARIIHDPVLIPIIGPDGLPTTILVPTAAGQVVAAEDESTVHTLMNPHILAASGEEQRLFAGENVPIPATTPVAEGAAADPFVTRQSIQRQDVGIDLRVTPTAVSENVVALKLVLRFSSVLPPAAIVASLANPGAPPIPEEFAELLGEVGEDGPILRQFDIETEVRLVGGSAVLVASAPQDKRTEEVFAPPLLGSIPVLGSWLRVTRDTWRSSRLLVIAQASTVNSPDDERAEAIQRRLAMERHLQRTNPLRSSVDPYALLVTTRTVRDDADVIAFSLREIGETRIVEWESGRGTHFDVYLVGLAQLSEVAPTSLRLREKGYRPKLTFVGASVPE